MLGFRIIVLCFTFLSISQIANAQKGFYLGVQVGGVTPIIGYDKNAMLPPHFFMSSVKALSGVGFVQYGFTENIFIRGQVKRTDFRYAYNYKTEAPPIKYNSTHGTGFQPTLWGGTIGLRSNGKLNQKLYLTAQLGGEYLNVKSLIYYTPEYSFGDYHLEANTKNLVENQVLTTGALGVELKTKNANFITLEIAYSHSFKPIWQTEYSLRDPTTNNKYPALIQLKGSYAEVRLGYKLAGVKVKRLTKVKE